MFVARLHPRRGMRIESTLRGWAPSRVRKTLEGLPLAHGYRLVVKPLLYRRRPSLQAMCDFEARQIVVQVPEPFHLFTVPIAIRAKRLPGRKLRFAWFNRRVVFRSRRDVIRFLYLHEYFHWYLWEVLGRKAAAETACDRFALENFRRRVWITPAAEMPVRSLPRSTRTAARK